MKILNKFNNGNVIASVKKSELKGFDFADATLLTESGIANDTLHLGNLQLFETAGILKVPFLKDPFMNSDHIYVNGRNGRFDYTVEFKDSGCTVVENIEEAGQLGLGGAAFRIKLTHEYRKGDILTYDPIDGVQVVVVDSDDAVVDTGDGFIHLVVVSSGKNEDWFPANKLSKGVEFIKVGNISGEFNATFSGIQHMSGNNKVTLEYILGDITGVEVAWTEYADALEIGTGGQGSAKENSYITEMLMRQKYNMGDGDYMAIIAPNQAGKLTTSNIKAIGSLLPMLAQAELYRILAMQMMFAKGGTITGGNGSKRINEGLYHQMRRGHRFTYSNTSELRDRIRAAADVIYRGIPIDPTLRNLTFKAGFMAYTLVREMFKQEFQNNTPMAIDADALAPHKVLSGSDMNNLAFRTYAIKTAYLNGIGNVTIEHDPSFDYDLGDYLETGFNKGYGKRSWSLAIWDVTNSMYSNRMDKSVLPKGIEIDSRSTGKNNLYLVQPKGRGIAYGSEKGRTYGQGVASSNTTMGETFWAYGQMAGFIPDLSKVVLIERPEETPYFK